MKKQLLLLMGLCLGLNVHSQIIFENGYYINNVNQKIECQIKNVDWKNNPKEFIYQLSDNTGEKTLNINEVQEFGIYNTSKYVRFKVNIDRSRDNLNELSETKKPEFNEETLFLKVILEGKANLYEFEDLNLRRFFYKKDSLEVKQLIYKLYRDSEYTVRRNDEFRKQLWDDLKCYNIQVNELEKMQYEKRELINFFINYYNCNNLEFSNLENKPKKIRFHLSLRPGINTSSLFITNNSSSINEINFGNKQGLRLGIETEFVLPFNKNKWAIIIEPTYQGFKKEQEITYRAGTIAEYQELYKADYKSIEFAIGVRHYFFLNPNSNLFVNGSFVYDNIIRKSIIDFESRTDLEIYRSSNFAFGLGYKFYKKFNIELRYQSRDILTNYTTWSSKYKSFSVIFGYTIF